MGCGHRAPEVTTVIPHAADMFDGLTAAALRALARAADRARLRRAAACEPEDLLAALVEDEESQASRLLGKFGVERGALLESLAAPAGAIAPEPDPGPAPLAFETRAIVGHATEFARAVDRSREVGTEHLLAAIADFPGPPSALLGQAGLNAPDLLDHLRRRVAVETSILPIDPEMPPLELEAPGEAHDLARILDAAANRAREGLRVVEDYARFVLDDAALTRRLKDCRHRLSAATRALDADEAGIIARYTRGDVGTHIMTAGEQTRENPRAVLSANLRRAGEALRTLEEYSKLSDVWLAGRFEVLRYDVYTLEKLVLTAVAARARMAGARLYVLVGNHATEKELIWIVSDALAGGAQVNQLREKGLPDREFLRLAREVRILTAQARAIFVVNDRPDLARLAGADGVHLGQDDLSVRDARRILGPTALVGVSTHDAPQIERATLDGASYLGVGPVFASETKEFADFAGLAFVAQAAETTTRPWFAIGGIGEHNVEQVLEAGATRIAVGGAITRAGRPRAVAAALRSRLDALGPSIP